jgi:hypothetical protein
VCTVRMRWAGAPTQLARSVMVVPQQLLVACWVRYGARFGLAAPHISAPYAVAVLFRSRPHRPSTRRVHMMITCETARLTLQALRWLGCTCRCGDHVAARSLPATLHCDNMCDWGRHSAWCDVVIHAMSHLAIDRPPAGVRGPGWQLAQQCRWCSGVRCGTALLPRVACAHGRWHLQHAFQHGWRWQPLRDQL